MLVAGLLLHSRSAGHSGGFKSAVAVLLQGVELSKQKWLVRGWFSSACIKGPCSLITAVRGDGSNSR